MAVQLPVPAASLCLCLCLACCLPACLSACASSAPSCLCLACCIPHQMSLPTHTHTHTHTTNTHQHTHSHTHTLAQCATHTHTLAQCATHTHTHHTHSHTCPPRSLPQMEVQLPFSAGDMLNDIHTQGKMLEEPHFTESGDGRGCAPTPAVGFGLLGSVGFGWALCSAGWLLCGAAVRGLGGQFGEVALLPSARSTALEGAALWS